MSGKTSNADEFLNFIEKMSNIELYSYQKMFLKFLYNNPTATQLMNSRMVSRNTSFYNIKRICESVLTVNDIDVGKRG